MLLAPYRVLDLTGPLGFMAGRVLADLGADVVKIEPPGGDPARRTPPTVQTADGPQGVFWLTGNANKKSAVIDVSQPQGQALFRRLAAEADFVLESYAPGTLEEWGLGYVDLSRSNPGLIMVSVTPFGQHGPYRDFRASDLEIMALSGAMSLAGEADGEPMRVSVPQSPMFAGLEAAMGALSALAARAVTGRGQHVDVSAQVAVMAAVSHAPAFWDLNRENPGRAGTFVTGRTLTGARMRALWPCRDGWINFIVYGGAAGRETNRQLVSWMQETGMAPESLLPMDWENFRVPQLTQDEVDRLERPIGEFLATLTKREFYEGVTSRGMLGYPVSTVADLLSDPQLQARDFWRKLPLDAEHEATVPGGFAIVDGDRLAVSRAPRAGEHNDMLVEED